MAILGLFLPFSPISNPKEGFLEIKIFSHIRVNSHGHRMYTSYNTARDRQFDVKIDTLMGFWG